MQQVGVHALYTLLMVHGHLQVNNGPCTNWGTLYGISHAWYLVALLRILPQIRALARGAQTINCVCINNTQARDQFHRSR